MRRYELDWLRVIVFGLLIFYHVGMFFVPWDWHIKNNIINQALVYPMMFLNQWRLPILFVISGMGTAFALSRKGGWHFARERIVRLFIPLLAGIILVVPPQVYLERISTGEFAGSFFSFWPRQAFTRIYPNGNFSWHHLWFLPYLLFFSLVLTPLFLYLRNKSEAIILRFFRQLFSRWWTTYFLIIPLLLFELFLRPAFPPTNAFWGDWYNLARYITLFFYGFLSVSAGHVFWQTISANRFYFLLAGCIGFTSFMLAYIFADQPWHIQMLYLFRTVSMWSWIICILGFAHIYLNKPGKYLDYANQAVYPFYIFHQTITVFLGFLIMRLNWSFPVKAIIMITGTFGITLLIYELIVKRWHIARLLFGLKTHKKREDVIVKR